MIGSRTEGLDHALLGQHLMRSEEDLAQLPENAVVSVFGCGNAPAFSEVRSGDVGLGIGLWRRQRLPAGGAEDRPYCFT
jgi:hypothetical protein